MMDLHAHRICLEVYPIHPVFAHFRVEHGWQLNSFYNCLTFWPPKANCIQTSKEEKKKQREIIEEIFIQLSGLLVWRDHSVFID